MPAVGIARPCVVVMPGDRRVARGDDAPDHHRRPHRPWHREHAAGDRQAADDKRRRRSDHEPRPTPMASRPTRQSRRLAERTLVGPLRRRRAVSAYPTACCASRALSAGRGRRNSSRSSLVTTPAGRPPRTTSRAGRAAGQQRRTPRRRSPPTSSVGSGRSITSPTVRSTTRGSRYARSSRPFSLTEPTIPSRASPSACSDTGQLADAVLAGAGRSRTRRGPSSGRAPRRASAGRGGAPRAARRPGRPRRSSASRPLARIHSSL